MKVAKLVVAVGVLGLICGLSTLAQVNQSNSGSGNTGGNTGQANADWSQIQAYLESLRNGWRANRPAPPRPEPVIPQNLMELVKEAKEAAVEFTEKQNNLLQQMKNATDTQREQLREQLREASNTFRGEQKQRVQEMKAQMLQLREQFRDNRDQVIEAAKEQGKTARGR